MLLSNPPETTYFLSSVIATAAAQFECSCKMNCSPYMHESHIFMVLSALPETINLLFWLRDTEIMGAVWPFNVLISTLRIKFQIFIVLSLLPDTMKVTSLLMASEVID